MKSKPYVGQRVKLSAMGYSEGLVRSPEDAKCAAGTVITYVSDDGYINGPLWEVEVEGSLSRFMLHSDHFEELL